MYNVDDTIIAVSSGSLASGPARSIVRVSGLNAHVAVGGLFSGEINGGARRVVSGRIVLEDGVEVRALVYLFFAGRSYTGEDMAEIHLFASPSVIESVFAKLSAGARAAGPGEFTLRAYLNGRIDLCQAEAVAEIVASSNKFQLGAAEKLLAGRLSETIGRVREKMLDVLSLIEAGMDFSTEDIEFVSKEDAVGSVAEIKGELEGLLDGSIRYEEMIDMGSVGLAGASNAGKSSLLNALLGEERSIISETIATTRDVLTGALEMDRCKCAVFDCAGLVYRCDEADILQSLGQEAAIEALNASSLVVFCVDVSKEDYGEDVGIRKLLRSENVVVAASKCDLLEGEMLDRKLRELEGLFSQEPVVTSVVSPGGLDCLRSVIEEKIIELTSGSEEAADRIAITQRHRLAVGEAVKSLEDAAGQIENGNDEVAAMLLRSGYEELAGLEREDIDEAVLERIFSSFCIGK